MECLVRVWEPPVTGAGLIIVRPSVTIYGAKMTTKCGTSGVNAFYCAADQQVYYSNRLDDELPIIAQDKWAADVVIAHEFGHALQARTGILISAKALGQNSNDEKTDLLYSRRLETQADCFSGMYIRSVSQSLGINQSDLAGIEDTYKAVGDDSVTGDSTVLGNHGLARSRVFWGDAGIGNAQISACNTFTAPANQVR
nr:neutral zinc metallopeptidase [Microlunatus antarcticus]